MNTNDRRFRCQDCKRVFNAAQASDPERENRFRRDCPNCGSETRGFMAPWYWEVTIKATHVANIACDVSCRTATTDKCRCSCGGADHGIGAGAAHMKEAIA